MNLLRAVVSDFLRYFSICQKISLPLWEATAAPTVQAYSRQWPSHHIRTPPLRPIPLYPHARGAEALEAWLQMAENKNLSVKPAFFRARLTHYQGAGWLSGSKLRIAKSLQRRCARKTQLKQEDSTA